MVVASCAFFIKMHRISYSERCLEQNILATNSKFKTPQIQSIQQKIEYQSSVCLPYIGPASHKIERILRNEAGIKVYHSSENKLFRALCTHKDNVNESQNLVCTAFLVNVV
jgi:hypothetical protein